MAIKAFLSVDGAACAGAFLKSAVVKVFCAGEGARVLSTSLGAGGGFAGGVAEATLSLLSFGLIAIGIKSMPVVAVPDVIPKASASRRSAIDVPVAIVGITSFNPITKGLFVGCAGAPEVGFIVGVDGAAGFVNEEKSCIPRGSAC